MLIGAGLPNIYGAVVTYNSASIEVIAEGAFTSTQTEYPNVSTSQGAGRRQIIYLNANTLSVLYGASNTVTPKSLGVQFCIKF